MFPGTKFIFIDISNYFVVTYCWICLKTFRSIGIINSSNKKSKTILSIMKKLECSQISEFIYSIGYTKIKWYGGHRFNKSFRGSKFVHKSRVRTKVGNGTDTEPKIRVPVRLGFLFLWENIIVSLQEYPCVFLNFQNVTINGVSGRF